MQNSPGYCDHVAAGDGKQIRGFWPGGDGQQGVIARHKRGANATQQGSSVRLSNRMRPSGSWLYQRQTPRVHADERRLWAAPWWVQKLALTKDP